MGERVLGRGGELSNRVHGLRVRLRGVDIRPCGKPDRRSRLRELAPARPALQIVWASIWPALAGAAILQGMGLLMESAGSWGSPGQFPWVDRKSVV